MQENEIIPWFDFAMWLRDGYHAANILNTFMAGHKSTSDQSIFSSDQINFLEKVFNELSDGDFYHHRISIRKSINAAQELKHRENFDETDVQNLWMALMFYGTNNHIYSKVEDKLKYLFNHEAHMNNGCINIINGTLDIVWRSLGPASAPDLDMLEP